MKLLVTTDQWSPDVTGGSARVAADTARALARRGHDVLVLAPRLPDLPAVERDGSLEVRRITHRGPFPRTIADFEETLRVARRLRGEWDVLVPHQTSNAVALLAASLQAPLAFVFHASVPLEQEFLRRRLSAVPRAKSLALAPVIAGFERIAVRRADTVLVLSDFSRQLVVSAHPSARERVVNVTGGIDTDVFRPPHDRGTLRDRLGVGVAEVFLLSVRRLEPRMGLEQLIRAARLLADEGLAFTVGIAGEGMLAGSLQSLVDTLRLGDHVRLLGRVPEDELPGLYGAADLFVLPTVAYEGFGMVTVEALATGTPVVGTAVGATPELLVPLDSDFVSPTPEPGDLAAAVRRVLPRLDDALRERCAAYARSRYGWSSAIEDWEAALVATRASAG